MPQKNKTFTLTDEELEQFREVHNRNKRRSFSATIGWLISQEYNRTKQPEQVTSDEHSRI